MTVKTLKELEENSKNTPKEFRSTALTVGSISFTAETSETKISTKLSEDLLLKEHSKKHYPHKTLTISA